ncbi:hypothetical protein [Metabacillus kandeliae]|nr:hypothetical protein [Metabacillus kandeliae]
MPHLFFELFLEGDRYKVPFLLSYIGGSLQDIGDSPSDIGG